MVSYFKDEKRWSYSEPRTVFDVEFNRVGRDTQLSEIWNDILTCNRGSPTKPLVLYFHGSPGLGKTYLLRKLFSKEGFPSEWTEVKEVKFLVLDFGLDGCRQASIYKEDFKEHPDLFALSRLYYVTFAVQSKVTWRQFLKNTVVPLIRAKLTDDLKKLMIKQLKVASGGEKERCVILVDEIMKVELLGVGFANRVRSAVCQWMRELCRVVLFSTLDATFITQECDSGRAVYGVTTLPLLSQTDSISFFNKYIKVDFIDGLERPVERATYIKQLALASGGHPRSIQVACEAWSSYRLI